MKQGRENNSTVERIGGVKKYPKKVNTVLFNLGAILLRLFSNTVWNTKVKSNIDKNGGPYLIVANHQSNIDAFITVGALYPLKAHYVTADYQYRTPLTNVLFRYLGTIPKKQFYPDINSILEMKRAIGRGNSVIIFPAGQSSYTGACTCIPGGMGRLIKHLKAPVVNIQIRGAHLLFPKWDMTYFRRTRVEVSIDVMLTADDLLAMTEPEIEDKINSAMLCDDYEWQREKMLPYKHIRRTKGLNHLLFICPVCKSEFKINSERNTLVCQNCGAKATMDRYGFLSHEPALNMSLDTPVKWYNWQREYLAGLIKAGSYIYSATGEVFKADEKHKFRKQGVGEVSISASGLNVCYDDKQLHFDVTNHVTLPFEDLNWFEVFEKDELYRIRFKNPGEAYKYVIICELLYVLR